MSQLIYKIVDRALWEAALQSGRFEGAEIDVQDGYIHFSAADQVEETVRKHFAGRDNLLLIEVDTATLMTAFEVAGKSLSPSNESDGPLRWEVSRHGDRFPHLYAPLDVKLIKATYELPLGDDGDHVFPPLSATTDDLP